MRYSTHQLVDGGIAVVKWEQGQITEIVKVFYKKRREEKARYFAVHLNRVKGVYGA